MKYFPIFTSQFQIVGDVVLIRLNRCSAIIDLQDLRLVQGLNWYLFRTKWGNYAAAMYKEGNKRRFVLLHRLLLSPAPDKQIDHIDHNGLNNRRSNLRICTNKQNGENRKGADKDSQSGVRNVHPSCCGRAHPLYWAVQVGSGHNRITKNFPYTDEGLELAKKAAKEMRQQLFTHAVS